MKIEKGFTIWAKQACDSKIFLDKPDHWFKVWFYIVSKVNFKDNGNIKRGQGFFTYQELVSILKPKNSRSVIDRIMRWLRTDDMLTTRKTTRGLLITVNNYDKYQDITNYVDDTIKSNQTRARRQPDDTIQKEEKERIIPPTPFKGDMESQLLNAFNQTLKTNFKTLKPYQANITHWLSIYSTEDVVTAIRQIPRHEFWKDKMTPTIFFRQTDRQKNPVDYIGEMLNIKAKKGEYERL